MTCAAFYARRLIVREKIDRLAWRQSERPDDRITERRNGVGALLVCEDQENVGAFHRLRRRNVRGVFMMIHCCAVA